MDLVGDHWSLVVIRDMINGKLRFGQFLDSPERITTIILTDRLFGMEHAGLIKRRPYSLRPGRYEYSLTARGHGLLPVLQEICRWANSHFPETWIPPEGFMSDVPSDL